jgi:hypothetical protein
LISHVTSVKPTIGGHGLFCGLRVVEVSLHDNMATQLNFPLGVERKRVEIFIGDAKLQAGKGFSGGRKEKPLLLVRDRAFYVVKARRAGL